MLDMQSVSMYEAWLVQLSLVAYIHGYHGEKNSSNLGFGLTKFNGSFDMLKGITFWSNSSTRFNVGEFSEFILPPFLFSVIIIWCTVTINDKRSFHT
jgi:hypothetical protein